jgi:hypothetical protein
MIVVLLLAVLVVISDNNQKYAGALGRASTALARTQTAIDRLLTATQRAVETRTSVTVYPYDPTLYAQRQHETFLLLTVGGPTEYAIFYATETALVATYQGTPTP